MQSLSRPCTVIFAPFHSLEGHPIEGGITYGEGRQIICNHLKHHRRKERCVSILEKGLEWEVVDDEDPFVGGTLVIRLTPIVGTCEHCGKQIAKGEDYYYLYGANDPAFISCSTYCFEKVMEKDLALDEEECMESEDE